MAAPLNAPARNKQNATKARFEARRFSPYPKRRKNTPAEFDLCGNRLSNSLVPVSITKTYKKLCRRTENGEESKSRSKSALRAASQSLDEFFESRAEQEKLDTRKQIYRMVQLDLLRSYGVEPTWLGVGQRTPRELALANRRNKQALLTRGNYVLELGEEYAGVYIEIINIAATFSLGITNINTRGFLLACGGIQGHLGIPQFLACSVCLALEHHGKVISVRIFESGIVSITGAKSETEALIGAHLCVRYLRNHGVDCSVLNFEIVNVVSVFNLGHFVDIVKMSDDFPRTNLAKYIRASRLPGRSGLATEATFHTAIENPPMLPTIPDIDIPSVQEPSLDQLALVSLSTALGVRTKKHWSDDPRDFPYSEPEVGKNSKFAAIVVHIDKVEFASGICLKPPAISLSSAGTGVCCGAKNIEHARHAMERAVRIFRRYRTTEKFSPKRTRDAFGANIVSDVRGIMAQVAATVAWEQDQARASDPLNIGRHSDEDAEDGESECIAAMIESGAAESFMGACISDLFMCELQEEGVAGITLVHPDSPGEGDY